MAKRPRGKTLIQSSREKSPQEKALYHQVLGAGRARVRRQFLGLTKADEEVIARRLEAGILARLAKGAT